MSPSIIGTILIVIAVTADILANIFVKKSDGFRQKGYGILALIGVGIAFLCLGLAIHYIELSVAYALFGAIGILCTTSVDKLFFNLQVRPIGVLGMITMIGGIILLQTA